MATRLVVLFCAMLFAVPAGAQHLGISLYKPNYFIADWRDDHGQAWVKWSISFKVSLVQATYFPRWLRFIPPGRPTLAYTHEAFWDILAPSSPFDEHDFNPEVFYETDHSRVGWHHESTGVAGLKSRSWDRVFWEYRYDYYSTSLYSRIFYIALIGAENPDIQDHTGIGKTRFGWQLTAVYRSADWVRLALQAAQYRGLAEASVRVFRDANWFLYTQLHYGRGENLVGYSESHLAGGVGIALIKRP